MFQKRDHFYKRKKDLVFTKESSFLEHEKMVDEMFQKVIVLVCLLAFCYKCLCFRPKKERRPYNSNNINNSSNNNNPRTVANERPKTVTTTDEGLFTNLFSTDTLNTKRKQRSSSPVKNYNESGVDVAQV